MGGKSGTTTQSVSIPPQVLARYNAVNAQAQKVAATPFQQYSQDPNAFVAPINQQQYAGIGAINNAANMAQPAYAAAEQGTFNAAQSANPANFQSGVSNYMNPYLQNAVGATVNQMQNVNKQQQQGMLGNAISQGAFGGDRANIGLANLMNQQNLALGQTVGNMENQGFQNAAQNYFTGLGQQGALYNQLGNLGGQAQGAALQGAQAQLGAGTLEQQTQQAGQTALYNQFLQQQAYPFQVAQFLANIAEGTGSLSGSNTTTTQPMPFFSDRRLKEDIQHVGKAKNGLPIYSFKYKGDPSEQTHIGFMADEVEKKHPDAVGLAGGYKTVDYSKAVRPTKNAGGLLSSEGGVVAPERAGMGFADGGMPTALANMIAQQNAMPTTGGGINADVAAQARAIAPTPIVPPTVTAAPGYNVFADPQYQPDLTGTTTTGKGFGHNDQHQNSVNQTVSTTTPGTQDVNNPFHHFDNQTTANRGGAMDREHHAFGSSAGYDPYDPNSVQNLLSRQADFYKNLEGSHVPSSRQLTGGIGKHGRVPEGGVAVKPLMQAGQIPRLPEPAGNQAIDLAGKGRDWYDWYKNKQQKPAAQPSQISGQQTQQTQQPPTEQKPDTVQKTSGLVPSDTQNQIAAVPPTDVAAAADIPQDDSSIGAKRGGLIVREHHADGLAAGQQDDQTIDDMYDPEKTKSSKLDIPDANKHYSLPTAGQAPGQTSQTGLSAGTALGLAKDALGFLLFKDGGRTGYGSGGDPTADDTNPFDVTKDNAPNFQKSVGRLLQSEGGYNAKDSNGAPVNMGINQAYHPDVDVSKLTKQQATDIYKKQYWDTIGADSMDPALAHVALDTSAMAGPATAKKLLAQSDGTAEGFMKERNAYLQSLVEKNPEKFGPYAKSWNNRTQALYSDIGLKPDVNAIGSSEAKGSNPDIVNVALAKTNAAAAPAPESQDNGQSGSPNLTLPWQANTPPNAMDKIGKAMGIPEDYRDSSLWLPILAGLGSMAQSRSPFFLGAALEGLGGGAQAYMNVQKQKADIEAERTNTMSTAAGVPSQYILNVNGVPSVIVPGPDGRLRPVSLDDYAKMGSPPLDPRNIANYYSNNGAKTPGLVGNPNVPVNAAPPAAEVKPDSGTPAPAAPPASGVAPPAGKFVPNTGVVPQPQTTAAPTSDFSDEDAQAAIASNKKVQSMPIESRNKISGDAFNQFYGNAENIRQQQQNMFTLGHSLASIPEDSALGSGKYSEASKDVMNSLNSALKIAGVSYQFGDPKQMADAEEVSKVRKLLQQKMATAADQHSYAGLEDMLGGLPGLINTPQGKAQLMADLMVQNQRELDKAEYMRKWENSISGNAGNRAIGGGNFSALTWQDALAQFEKKHPISSYQTDKENITKLWSMKNGANSNAFAALTGPDAQKLLHDPKYEKQRAKLAEMVGPSTLRYFDQ